MREDRQEDGCTGAGESVAGFWHAHGKEKRRKERKGEYMVSGVLMGKSSDGRIGWRCIWLLTRPWVGIATEEAGGKEGGFWCVHGKEKRRKERKGE